MIFNPLSPGSSVESMPIEVFKSDIKSDKHIYLMAGVHGDEVEGVYVLKQLFDWLKINHTLEELPLIVIPIVNVDGYRAGTRVNSHGVDLNRNLPSSCWTAEHKKAKYHPGDKALSEPENQFLFKLFEKYQPGLILSFHSWKELINYNGKCLDVAEFLSQGNQYPVADNIGYETPGSLGSYAPEVFNSPVITFECPLIDDDCSLQDIWNKNEKPLKELFESGLLSTYL